MFQLFLSSPEAAQSHSKRSEIKQDHVGEKEATERTSNSSPEIECGPSLGKAFVPNLAQPSIVNEETIPESKYKLPSSNVLMILLVLVTVIITSSLLAVGIPRRQRSRTSQNPQVDLTNQSLKPQAEYEERYLSFRSMIGQESDPTAFLDPNSPQSQALDWLVYKDQEIETKDTPILRLLQRYALMVVHFSCGGSGWTIGGYRAYHEAVDTHECLFIGVICDPVSSRITVLDLHERRLTGKIPTEIGLLSNLEKLDLEKNFLQGQLPTSVGKLVELVKLDVSSNELTGPIPSEMVNLQKMRNFVIEYNFFTVLPEGVTKLPGMISFISRNNPDLQGSFSGFLTNCPLLEALAVRSTRLTGTFPEDINSTAPVLAYVDLSLTKASGSLPSSITKVSTLQVLQLRGLPTMEVAIPSDIGTMPRLTNVQIEGVKGSGTIPPSIGLVSNLEIFSLQRGGFAGTIPTELGLNSLLKNLQIVDTAIHGTIPSELGRLTELRQLELFGGSLAGSVPASLCQHGFLSSNIRVSCSISCFCCPNTADCN